MLKHMRSFPAQVVLGTLVLTLALLVVALGGSALHTDAMRQMVATRNERAVQAAAAGLATELGAEQSSEHMLQLAKQWLSVDQESSDQFILFLLDQEGKVLAHSDPAYMGVDWSDHPGAMDARQGKVGSVFERHTETNTDNEVVIAYGPIGNSGWSLFIEEPWSTIANPLLRYSQIAPLVLIPALLMTAGVLLFGFRQVIQPLQRLDAQATQLGWGYFDALNQAVGGIEAIQALQTTLDRMARQLQAAQIGMRSYVAALTQGQEDERGRLARELHDETVQALIALEHQAFMLRRAIVRDPTRADEKAQELAKTAADAVQELRRVIRALRPLYLDELGWAPAVQALVNDLNKYNSLDASFRRQGEDKRLEPAAELALYRIAQEAIQNVTRHSQATRVEVSIINDNHKTILSVKDNGQGFDPPHRPEELAVAGHYGLMGMHERAQLIGAQLCITSEPKEGTEIMVTLDGTPLEDEPTLATTASC